jgi:prephenate dehydrogenase
MRVGVVGLGLMGGSLALSLKKLDFIQSVIGSDHNIEHQKEAIALNLVDEIVDFEIIKTCDIIILAIPVNGVISSLKQLTDIPKTTIIIDLGSTKEIIVNSVPKEIRKNFVAAHPMTGTEHSGPTSAQENLYHDKVVVLCDLEHSGEYQRDIAVKIFNEIGMNLHYMKAHAHDRHAAFISHLPHAISFSLANIVLDQEDKDNILTLAAGGFRSMSRLAKSSPYMWEDVFKQNSENLLESIELFEKELTKMKVLIKEGNFDEVHQQMKDANELQKIFT